MKEKEQKQEESVVFTSLDELSKYNEKLLNGFIAYLNNKHKKNHDVFHCGASVQIFESEEFVKEFNELVMKGMNKEREKK